MQRMTDSEREELFRSVDLRVLTGRPVPRRPNASVRTDCPIHGGRGDLGIFRDHSFCFSAKCGWRGRAFDTAAILLGLYSNSDPLWPSKAYGTVITKLRDLAAGQDSPREREGVAAPSREQLERWTEQATGRISLDRFARWRGIPRRGLERYRLGKYAGNLAIPVLDKDGKVVNIRYRRPDDGEPRYWGVPGLNQSLIYGEATIPANPWKWAGRVLALVEGELDTVALQQIGIPAIAFTNGAGWKNERQALLDSLEFDWLVSLLDRDEAGHDSVHGYTTLRGNFVPGLKQALGTQAHKLIEVPWPKAWGKDPNEVVANGRGQNLIKFIGTSLQFAGE